MERYTCNGAYLEKFSNGAFVKYSDHVAEVGKITDQLESLRTTLCSSLAAHSDHAAAMSKLTEELDELRAALRDALAAHSDHAAELAEWKQRAERAEAYVAGQDVRSDFRNAGEMRAALDAALADVSMRSREVFRESQLRRNIEEMMKEHAEYLRENRMLDDQARAATDAAGILKGAE